MTLRRLLMRFVVAATVLVIPTVLIAACGGGGFDEDGSSAPADVPELGAAQLGGGAGPTPIPVTPTPTATPSPKHLSAYEPVWEGTYTIRETITKEDVTKNITLEFNPPLLIGEGKDRRRDVGAIFVEGTTNWMALAFVNVDPETGDVSFRIPTLNARFQGVLEDDKISGTAEQGTLNKGAFEVKANADKSPKRRPEAEAAAAP